MLSVQHLFFFFPPVVPSNLVKILIARCCLLCDDDGHVTQSGLIRLLLSALVIGPEVGTWPILSQPQSSSQRAEFVREEASLFAISLKDDKSFDLICWDYFCYRVQRTCQVQKEIRTKRWVDERRKRKRRITDDNVCGPDSSNLWKFEKFSFFLFKLIWIRFL